MVSVAFVLETSEARADFAAAAQDGGSLWIMGGTGSTRVLSDVWRTRDGVTWELVISVAAWGPRSGAGVHILSGHGAHLL
eukprot:516992-Amphidinium_carterae.1